MGEKQQQQQQQAAMEEQALKPQQGYKGVPYYKRRKCRVCCGVCALVLVALAVVAVALSQTIFKFRDPEVTLENVKLQNVSFNLDLAQLAALVSVSLAADVRVDNPNHYSFRYSDSRVAMLYHSDQVGVVELGAGTIRSRKTVDLPAVITIEAVRLLANSLQDLTSNIMSFKVNTAMSGRVNLANIYKKHVDVVLNCTMDLFISNTSLKDNNCKQTIKM